MCSKNKKCQKLQNKDLGILYQVHFPSGHPSHDYSNLSTVNLGVLLDELSVGKLVLAAVDPSLQPLLRKTMEMVQLNNMCVIHGKQVRDQKCVRRPIITQSTVANKPCDLLCVQKNNMYIYN